MDANIIGDSFIISIKNRETDTELCKARYFVQGHLYQDLTRLVHPASALRQSPSRPLAAITAIFGFLVCSQDVNQAYLQSSGQVLHDVYLKPPKELNLAGKQLFKLLKPL